jgi:predicted phosphodiesterase
MVHGSPAYPHHQYLFEANTARASLKFLKTNICFFGHTHVPYCFRFCANGKTYNLDFKQKDTLWLNNEDKYFINPGSVGQPRDRNRDAAYMIYDTHQKNIMTVRVQYNIGRTQERINSLKLPREFATRLSYGS